MNLGVDPRHADQMVRGVVSLPNGTGRRSASRCSRAAPRRTRRRPPAPTWSARRTWSRPCRGRDQLRPLHRDAGPDAAGRPARQGARPPRHDAEPEGRHRDDGCHKRRRGAKGGSVEFRVEKAGIVHAGVGKASFPAEKLVENIKAFADAVQKAKPPGRQGPLHQPRGDLLHDGPGCEDRRREPYGHDRRDVSRDRKSYRPSGRRLRSP